MDDTFWRGTLTEGGAIGIEKNMQLVRDLTDCGIINSICSKNDYEETKQHLISLGIWDMFVFPSINWEPKGWRIKQMIEQMALRSTNVLFIDDNTSNLGEAKHILSELQIAEPTIIPQLIEQVQMLDRKDAHHERLKQYKILEQKAEDAKAFESNEDFLYKSNIRVTIHQDCKTKLERIHELLMRSNQLNYTKKRISIDELQQLVDDKTYHCGYVTVMDNYGDYGIVGFYAIKDGVAEHYLFSCRTMGQMVEQWVYAQLGFPQIHVVGEVRTQLNQHDCPKWINQQQPQRQQNPFVSKKKELGRILIKGPCDLNRASSYMHKSTDIDLELTYVRDESGQPIFSQNHSVMICGLLYSDEQKKKLAAECPFLDPTMLYGKIFVEQYDTIFISTLLETKFGIYRRKESGELVVFGESHVDIHNRNNWERFIQNGIDGYYISYEELVRFCNAYDFIGTVTPQMYIENLLYILRHLPNNQTRICLILGATKYAKDEKLAHQHKVINEAIKELASQNERIDYIDVDAAIQGVSDYTDHLDHYQAKVYYYIAQEMARIASKGKVIKMISAKYVWLDTQLNKLKYHFNTKGRLYKTLRFIY